MKLPITNEPALYDLLFQLMDTGLITQEEFEWSKENLHITIGEYTDLEIIFYKYLNNEYLSNNHLISDIRYFIDSLK